MRKQLAVILTVLLSLLIGCERRDGQQDAGVVRIDGSSTVFPLAEAAAEEFQQHNKNVRVTVGISGTGGGFKKLARGEIDIANASRPILQSEMEACRANGIQYIEIPLAFDALTVIVNPSNDWVDSITLEELRKIWEPSAQGKITRWNQIRPEWPDAPLNLYGPGADSGTFDYFTEAVVGKAKSSRGDFTASEDDNVLVQGVSGDRNALGYLGYAYFAENRNRLKALAVGPAGSAVLPSHEAILQGNYQPLSRPIFVYVNQRSLETPAVREFLDYLLSNAAQLAEAVSNVPLPPAAYEQANKRLDAQQTGTAFGGTPDVGVTIDELFKRELHH